MPDVYLSHTSRDSEAARQIADALEREGVTCFLAPRDIAVGVEYGTAILSAITSSRVLVVLLSESANQSRQVDREVQTAANNGLPIIPYRIEDVSPRGSLVYFLSGVVFPVNQLPPWLQPVSLSLPTTYWLEGMRRAIAGVPPADSPLAGSPLAAWSNGQLLLALCATTVGLVVLSQLFYRWSVRRAWRSGRLEEVTGA